MCLIVSHFVEAFEKKLNSNKLYNKRTFFKLITFYYNFLLLLCFTPEVQIKRYVKDANHYIFHSKL